MSTPQKNAAALIEKLVADPAFQSRFTARVDSPEALFAFARAEGFEFDAAEFQNAWKARFGDSVAPDGSLSEEALAGVAGGFEEIAVKVFGITIGRVVDGRGSKNPFSVGN